MNRRNFVAKGVAAGTTCGLIPLSGCSTTDPEEQLEILSYQTSVDSYGNAYVVGKAENTSDRIMEYAQIDVMWYDGKDNQLHSNMDNIRNLGPGRTWKYQVIYPGRDPRHAAGYDIKVGEVVLEN